MHELLLQLMLDLLEHVDGFVLGRVRGPELDRLFSSLAAEEASCQFLVQGFECVLCGCITHHFGR